MRLYGIWIFILMILLYGCAVMEPLGELTGDMSGGSQLTVYVIDGTKGDITITERDISQAIMQLIDPLSNFQTKVWDPSNNSVFIFQTTRAGTHTFQLTDIDTASNTNVTKTNFNLRSGYNYNVKVTLGGSIDCYVTTNDDNYDPGPGWNLVWHDEFDGTMLDQSSWVYDIGTGPNGDGWGNNELEYYTSRTNNIRVRGDNLIIQALQESYGGRSYTSARIKTKDKVSWQYGKIVARIKVPFGKGLWPAFWMLGTNFNNANWPSCGEIDIMEMVGGGTIGDKTAYGSLFWYNGGTATFQRSTNIGKALSQDYHYYEIEWNSACIKIRIDQKDYFYYDISSSTYDLFRQPFFILLNMAVGGSWPGSPDGSTVFPQTMMVDWVRVYQRDPTKPALNISYPLDGTTLYGQFPVRGVVEGSNAVQAVYLSVDYAAYTLITNASVISYGLNLSAGNHNLRLYATDVSNKYSVTNSMDVIVTWTRPVITFTYMPPEGDTSKVQGQVTGVSPSMYKVSLQIYAYWLGWWIKPTSATPFTSLEGDGSWSSLYATGGVDYIARAMKAYLVPTYVDTTSGILSYAVAGVFSNRVDNHANTAYVIDPNSRGAYATKFNDFTNNSTVYTTSGVINFAGWAVDRDADGAVNYVNISVDNSPYTNTNYIGSYYQEWSFSRTWTAGSHKISVYKQNGLFGISETNTMNFTVVIDAVKPTVSPVSSNFTGSSVTISGAASDNVAVKKVMINWYLWHDFGSGPAWNNFGSLTANGTTSWSQTYDTGYTGTNLLEIYSVDMAGNESARITNLVYTY